MSAVPARVRAAAASATSVTVGRARRTTRRRAVIAALALGVGAVFAISLMVGNTFYGPGDVARVLLGETVPGASFTVGELRLPRAVLATLAGAAFGLGGVTFQTMLRNPLASPDIIGISAGASAAAVFGLVVLSLSGAAVSALAIVAALVTTLLIYLLSWSGGGVADSRLILIGIGIAAMLQSVINYVLMGAAVWDLHLAMRWLTGSVNAATWQQVLLLAAASAVLTPLLVGLSRRLTLMQHGNDLATALGVPVERTRLLALVAAVALIAFATAAAGPIAFVAFLSGPVAARALSAAGAGGSTMLPALLVGALLVLGGDLVGQFAFGTRYPVGVVTGVLGAPFLIYLLVRANRVGGSS